MAIVQNFGGPGCKASPTRCACKWQNWGDRASPTGKEMTKTIQKKRSGDNHEPTVTFLGWTRTPDERGSMTELPKWLRIMALIFPLASKWQSKDPTTTLSNKRMCKVAGTNVWILEASAMHIKLGKMNRAQKLYNMGKATKSEMFWQGLSVRNGWQTGLADTWPVACRRYSQSCIPSEPSCSLLGPRLRSCFNSVNLASNSWVLCCITCLSDPSKSVRKVSMVCCMTCMLDSCTFSMCWKRCVASATMASCDFETRSKDCCKLAIFSSCAASLVSMGPSNVRCVAGAAEDVAGLGPFHCAHGS